MDIYILDRSFNKLTIIDYYKSVLWIDRYAQPGEFELLMPADTDLLTYLVQGNYLIQKDSEHVMVIESLNIETDSEQGNHYVVKGRSIESLLDKRIIWKQTNFNNVILQNAIQTLLNENIISPTLTERKINNFIFKASTDSSITSLKLSAQYTGDNLLDVIEKICEDFKLGFKITLNTNNQFVFQLYFGKDRSYDQTANTYVIFSPDFDNIINTNYYESDASYKNVTLVAGEGEGSARKTVTVGTASGMNRIELYTDARDIQSESYAQQLEEDTEILNSYKTKLSDDQKLLSDEQAAAQSDATEYNKTAQAHQTLISQYTSRINVFTRRTNDYVSMKSSYVSSLPAETQTIVSNMNTYQANVDQYQALVDSSTDKISNYNNKLNNSLTITYDEVINYENLIKQEEATKATNQANVNYWSQMKSDEEAKLTDAQKTTLNDYDSMVSKYSGIVSNDTQKKSDEQTEATKDQTEYSQTAAAHNQLINQYNSAIATDNSNITTYTAIVAEDQRLLNEAYNALLIQRGKEKLTECKKEKLFDGKVDSSHMFIYGEDFFMGDIVQVKNEYGLEGPARVVEYVMSENNENGLEYYPTFEAIQNLEG